MIHFDLASKKMQLNDINALLLDSSIWEDSEKSKNLMKKQRSLQKSLDEFDHMQEKVEDIEMMIELVMDSKGDDGSDFKNDIYNGIEFLKRNIEKMKLQQLLSDEYDENNAILSIHAGSGGIDAMDWASMLYRMYTRWAVEHEYTIEIIDYQEDDVAGLKSATLRLVGEYAYGYLKSEKGVHRLVRISPFDSSGRRHTSFAAIDVLPELEDDEEIDIDSKDLRIDVYRASGAGGQHVNKTSSAVRITHMPSGIVVQCQNERSQMQNKHTAMKMLMAKLIDIQKQEHKEKIEDIQGDFSQITWGSQIRSYVFHPYQMVKDHRTNLEVSQVEDVMDGELDEFMNAYLSSK